MSHTVKIYDTCIGCTQCVRACPTDVLEMVIWEDCRAGQIASAPRIDPPIPIITTVLNFLNLFKSIVLKLNLNLLLKELKASFELSRFL